MIQEISVRDKYVLVNLSGSMYVEEAAKLREKLLGYIEDGNKTFIIYLGGVEYIDSAGLGTLVAIPKLVLSEGGAVIIKGIRGVVKDLFELTHLTTVFEIH
jgi:anti-sigma B factor antagonist